jgi:HSP20 family protein
MDGSFGPDRCGCPEIGWSQREEVTAMSTVITRWRDAGLAPFDWSGLGWFPPFAHAIKVEDFVEEGRYVVRAELPGVDPVKDVKVVYHDGALRLVVSRAEEHKDAARSEFHYGTFARTIVLPAGAKENTIVATYDAGILQIVVEIGEPAPAGRVIPIQAAVGNGKKH